MAKSRVRGGAKAHRKRVEVRNQHMKGQQNAMQRVFTESMKEQMEELQRNYAIEKSGNTETINN